MFLYCLDTNQNVGQVFSIASFDGPREIQLKVYVIVIQC